MSDRDWSDSVALSDSREAIRDYLDALLREIPEDDTAEEEPAASPPRHPERSVYGEAGRAQENPAVQTSTATDAAPATPPVSAESERPEGAFQALFFQVGSLRLAVALTELHSVVPRSEVDITSMPGQPSWQRGLMRYRGRNVRVIDTSAMVLPPDKRRSLDADAEPSQILVVGDGAWGLACHGIGDVIRLEAGEVRWRSSQGKRPWLAGTVIGHLCALIDTAAFARMLDANGSRTSQH